MYCGEVAPAILFKLKNGTSLFYAREEYAARILQFTLAMDEDDEDDGMLSIGDLFKGF